MGAALELVFVFIWSLTADAWEERESGMQTTGGLETHKRDKPRASVAEKTTNMKKKKHDKKPTKENRPKHVEEGKARHRMRQDGQGTATPLSQLSQDTQQQHETPSVSRRFSTKDATAQNTTTHPHSKR